MKNVMPCLNNCNKPEEANEQPNNSITEHFDFDIRQAIISSEILNRKY